MNSNITRPAMRYFGSKWRLAKWIASYLPAHKAYVEPFGGSASVLLQKMPSLIEVYNDLNSEVVNYFTVLREKPDELIRGLSLTPYSRQELSTCSDWSTPDPVERARRFYVCANQSRAFSGSPKTMGGWRKETRVTSNRNPNYIAKLWFDENSLYAVAKRFRNVQIENCNALDLIDQNSSPATLLYVDPPYSLETRADHRYAIDLDLETQKRLASALNASRSLVVLSGYRCEQYDEWYKDWHRVDCKTRTQASNMSTSRSEAIESLWLNKAASANRQSIFSHLNL